MAASEKSNMVADSKIAKIKKRFKLFSLTLILIPSPEM